MLHADKARPVTMRERPIVFSVFGVLNLCFGILGLFGALTGLLTILVQPQEAVGNPLLQAVRRYPAYAMHLKLSYLCGLVLGAALSGAGVGLLRMRPWGRALSIAAALLEIPLQVAATASSAYYLLPFVRDILLHQSGPQGLTPEQAGMVGGVIGAVLGSAMGVLYPLALLIFMLLSAAAMHRSAPGPLPCSPDSV